jgi:hypothetical protein
MHTQQQDYYSNRLSRGGAPAQLRLVKLQMRLNRCSLKLLKATATADRCAAAAAAATAAATRSGSSTHVIIADGTDCRMHSLLQYISSDCAQ